jgi:predicted RNA binding protein YcfA (HicA-like mRNA interferase family)
MKSDSLIKSIEKDGWFLVRTKGSHHHFKHPVKKGIVTVPHPKKDIPKGTYNSILKQAGLKLFKK